MVFVAAVVFHQVFVEIELLAHQGCVTNIKFLKENGKKYLYFLSDSL
uniref:Uncharacterized protein n=1 Tax=Meloidogyne enterolobii TaxID=390850 RepID=A0A6V7XI42_MELEN|nr:unnamed protein product [Meloidogyne enterolobii]